MVASYARGLSLSRQLTGRFCKSLEEAGLNRYRC